MDISDLWETAVLRDILGYIFPGTLTALALALLAGTILGSPVSRQLIEDLWNTYRWAFVAVLLPAGYVVGHTQARLVELVELMTKKTPLSRDNLAKWALDLHSMGHEYEAAAIKHFGGCPWKDADEPTWQMWRLCDYHVLHRAPQVHKTYMGRYNVLYVLFSNLSATAVLVWFATAASMEWGASSRMGGHLWDANQIRGLTILSVLSVLAVAFLACWAHRFRKNFMIRAFPTFYVITSGERPPRADRWGRPRPLSRSWIRPLVGLGVGLLMGRWAARRTQH